MSLLHHFFFSRFSFCLYKDRSDFGRLLDTTKRGYLFRFIFSFSFVNNADIFSCTVSQARSFLSSAPRLEFVLGIFIPTPIVSFFFFFFFNKFDLPRASNQRLDSTRFSFLLAFEHAINKYRFCRASVPRFSALYPFLTRIEFRMTRTKRMGSSIIFFLILFPCRRCLNRDGPAEPEVRRYTICPKGDFDQTQSIPFKNLHAHFRRIVLRLCSFRHQLLLLLLLFFFAVFSTGTYSRMGSSLFRR